MAYLGNRPDNVISNNAQNEFNYTATSNQTTFTGADSSGNILAYSVGNVEVFFNGARLEESDFTATNGTSIVLGTGATANDLISVIAISIFQVASISQFNTTNLSEGNNLYFTNARSRAAISVSGDLSYNSSTGVISSSGLASSTTDNLAEGSTNLYYTAARDTAQFNTDFTAKDTDALSEGSTNLYYTDARVDTKLAAGVSNIITTGYMRGPASFVIDPAAHGDDTGTVVIAGNLQVDGVQTTINSTTVEIDDLNFTIASDAADSAAANGAGITVGGAGATLNYTHATTSWDMNKPLNVTGDIGVTGTVDGVDIAARDAILTSTTTTAVAALPKAGGAMTGNVTFADSNEIVMGAGSDLKVYHHPTAGNHIFGSGTYGNIVIQSHQTEIKDNGGVVVADFSADSGSSARLYWASGAAYGGGVKLATTSTGVDITNIDLTAIAKDISVTADNLFVYDTRKDSDGGAWRKRTQNTSWYNEALNTATRGSRREFPCVAIIVIETTRITIYDGDDPDMPMWMVFSPNGIIDIYCSNQTRLTATAMNGQMVNGGGDGGNIFSFIEDYVYILYVNNNHNPTSSRTIEGRNDTTSYVSATGTAVDVYVVRDYRFNDVAITVLPNAPIDPVTGISVPTIAVATDGGVSVIKDDGTVADVTSAGGSTYHGVSWIDITANNHLIFEQDSQGRSVFCIPIPSSDRTTVVSDGNIADKVILKYYSTSTHLYPVYRGSGITLDSIAYGYDDDQALVSTDGELTLAKPNFNSPLNGMVAYVASDHNTGWQVGGSKLATLSDTDDTNATASGTNLLSGAWTNNGSFPYETFTQSGLDITSAINTTAYGAANRTWTPVVGKTYTASFTLTLNSGTAPYLYVESSSSHGNGQYYLTVNGANYFTFTATTSSSSYFNFSVNNGDATNFAVAGLTLVESGEADRSGNSNPLTVYGTVTKTAVATGADLVAYSGFSPDANRLQQLYNADYQFGTGDFSFNIWAKVTGTAIKYLFARYGSGSTGGNAGGGGGFGMYLNSSGKVATFISQAPSTNNEFASTRTINDGNWHLVSYVRSGNIAYVYIDGEPSGSMSLNASLNVNLANPYPLVVGNYSNLGYGWLGSLALLRISGTAPSAEQIKKIYNDEKHLFTTNAKATLYGTSDAVTALAYDDDTELLHAGTSAGRSVFQGLRRVDNTTDAVGASISASNGIVAED